MTDNPKKQVSFPVWDLETNEIIEMFMDEDDYNAMIEHEKQEALDEEERYKQMKEEAWRALQHHRDD